MTKMGLFHLFMGCREYNFWGVEKIADASAHANHLQAEVGLLTKGGLASKQILKSMDMFMAALGIESIKVTKESMQSICMTLDNIT